jgi:NAD+ synthase
MPQSQDEFYFALPYSEMDLCLFGMNIGVPKEEIATATGLTIEQVDSVFRDIVAKREATRYLHTPPVLMSAVEEVSPENGRAED